MAARYSTRPFSVFRGLFASHASAARPLSTRASVFRPLRTPILYFTLPAPRNFQTSSIHNGIMPESQNPPPRQAQDNETKLEQADQTYDEFHQRADTFFNVLTDKLEQIQEQDSSLEVEYSAGVLSVELSKSGTKYNYVLNKQPPNKQIWLSSPISGPKRYDWVVTGEGMNQKEGAGTGEWVYLRDGSKLVDLLKKEVGVDVKGWIYEA